MTDVLGRIDNVLQGGLCPCGAQPAPGSAYCGDDCTPTHRSVDTDPRTSGDYATPMRWRPDLVTAVDDTDLTPIDAPRPGYTGRHNPTIYRRSDGRFHFRLDDNHRYVGCDVDAPADERGVFLPEAVEQITAAWDRLDRELGNSRHLEPDDAPPPFGLGADPASWDTVLPAWMVADLRESFTRALHRATASSQSSRGSLWRPRPDPAAMTEAVHADHDCAAWPRVPNRTPLARYLLITQRLCYNCSRHGVPGPAVGTPPRHRCPHCAATYPGADLKVHIRADFQRDRYTIRITSSAGVCSRIINAEDAENRHAIRAVYDSAERAVLTELGLVPSRSLFDIDRAAYMHSLRYYVPPLSPASLLRGLTVT